MSLNQGAAIPSVPQGRFYHVISPRREVTIDAVLLADTFFGKWIHWVETVPGKGVTIPCDETEHCTHCKLGYPHRWNGYIAALDSRSRDFFVLALTEGCARQLLDHLPQYGTLRGLQFLFIRGKEKVNARVEPRLVGKCSEGVVPQEFSIHSSLSRLWGINAEAIRNGGRVPSAPLPKTGDSRVPPMPPRETYVPLGMPEDDAPTGQRQQREQPPKRITADEFLAIRARMKGVQ